MGEYIYYSAVANFGRTSEPDFKLGQLSSCNQIPEDIPVRCSYVFPVSLLPAMPLYGTRIDKPTLPVVATLKRPRASNNTADDMYKSAKHFKTTMYVRNSYTAGHPPPLSIDPGYF